MKIAQFQKNSLIDMPGHIACVIYTQGCNMVCEYCHNKQLVPRVEPKNPVSFNYIVSWLTKRKGLIEAVVFSGGEPTIQPDLLEKVSDCIIQGYKIGLHTNGTGVTFPLVAPLCNYILLSHSTPEKIEIAKQADVLDLSEVLWDENKQDWYNKITPCK